MKVLKLTISSLLIFILSYGVSNAQRVELFGVARNNCVASPDGGPVKPPKIGPPFKL